MGTPATESDWPGTEFGFDTSELSIYWPCNASSWVMKCLQKLPLYDRCHPMSTSTKSAVASCLFHRYSVWMCWEEAFHSFSPLIHGWIWPKMWVWSPREQMAFLALIIPSRIFIVSTPPKKPWWNVGDLCGTIEWCCNYRGWDKKKTVLRLYLSPRYWVMSQWCSYFAILFGEGNHLHPHFPNPFAICKEQLDSLE